MRSSSKKLSKFGISVEMVNNGLHKVSKSNEYGFFGIKILKLSESRLEEYMKGHNGHKGCLHNELRYEIFEIMLVFVNHIEDWFNG